MTGKPGAALLTNLLASFRRRNTDEGANDPEPELRFSSDWRAWQKRYSDRERRRIELAEIEALSSYPEDPAPLASEGLSPFLEWAKRQADRRRLRETAR